MFKWIRWPGLVAFLVIVGGISAFFLIFAAPLTKSAIQTVGTAINGAKVEVDKVSLSFNPIGISVHNLQVTDAREPMTNAVQLKKAVAELELAPLFAGRGIIRELSIDNLEFGTERSSSGAVEKKVKKATDEPSKLQEIKESIELPSAKDILASESLKTEKAGEDFKQGYEQSKAEIDQRLAAVPDDQTLKEYEDKLKAITSGDIKSIEDFRERKKQLEQLKADFKADQQAIEAARKAVSEGKDNIATNLKNLKNAPGEDVAYLKDKYQLNATGATNLTAMLFGDDAGKWAGQALYWYEIVKPYLASDDDDEVKEEPRIRDGRYIHFPTSTPWPSFLVRKISGTASLDWGALAISGEDLTNEPKVLGRPSNLAASGSELSNMSSLKLDLTLAHHISPGVDTLKLNIKDWSPAAMKLGVAGAELNSALTQVTSTAVVSGGQLSAEGSASFTQANFIGEGTNTFEREIVAALSGIKKFKVEGEAKGRLLTPRVKISSDLDKQMSQAINQRIGQKQQELEEELRAELNVKLEGYLGEHSSVLDDLANVEGGLDAKLDRLKSLAASELEDFEAQQRRQAQEKLEAEKEAARDKAKADAKGRIKSLF